MAVETVCRHFEDVAAGAEWLQASAQIVGMLLKVRPPKKMAATSPFRQLVASSHQLVASSHQLGARS